MPRFTSLKKVSTLKNVDAIFSQNSSFSSGFWNSLALISSMRSIENSVSIGSLSLETLHRFSYFEDMEQYLVTIMMNIRSIAHST